ncbi:NAD(P)/FAD-dependent oxidoreductase [Alphaproteobacteria bacterium LSUCC0684]
MVDAETDVLVVGAGAVGLAITRKLAMSGASVILAESNPGFGMETSSRNSEVIHAGIYYPTGSLKARLCVAGAAMMYAYCAERGVTTRKHGKLIVATEESQIEGLARLKDTGDANDVPGLELLGKDALLALEPEIKAIAALHSPVTGVVDSHGYMAALEADAENAGAVIAYQSRFEQAIYDGKRYIATIDGQGEKMSLAASRIINAAGHGSRKVSLAIDTMVPDKVPPHYMAKGQYFVSTRKPPFRHLIYPMPSGGGLGIHLTLDSGGGARFGPDIRWVDTPSYDVDPKDASRFHQLISSYWPALQPDELVPAWAGLRPKIIPDGSKFQDFVIATEREHGAPRVTALYGIDSPGLTSSLAIADHIFREMDLS